MDQAPHELIDLRRELPVLGQCIYLNTGTAGPLPRCASDAIQGAAELERTQGRGDFRSFGAFLEVREAARSLVAQLLHAAPREIALTHHTSDGVNIVLWGLRWKPGDELVTTSLEHDAVAVPAGVLARRLGVQARFADIGLGDQALGAVAAALSPRTRLLVLSHVMYSTGAALPVAPIVKLAHEQGVQVLVDGAQSCGVVPVDVRELEVDYYTVSGQKWLCGPEGTGALYVRADRLGELEATFASYFSAAHHDFAGQVALHDDARRFESGMVYRPALHGFRASLAWMLESVGIARAAERSVALARAARAMLESIEGVTLRTPEACQAGLLSFDLPAFSPARLRALASRWAAERQLIVRSIDHRPYALRASFGFFNTEAEVAELTSAVRDAAQQGPSAVVPLAGHSPLPDHREG